MTSNSNNNNINNSRLCAPQVATFCEISPGKHNFPREEENILEYWRKIDAFKQQLKKSEGQKPFTFYDGPPFATGKPHYGHILAGTIKDVVCRYATQTGHYVERRFGWDTHGVPVEYEIEKKLGITSREDVMAMGIAKYNEHCRSIVMRCASDWEHTVERMGRWIDFKNDYKTLDTSYMESCWWVFAQMAKKNLVYRDFKVMPYSTALNTPLSNFEAKSNYGTRIDPAVIVSFPLLPSAGKYQSPSASSSQSNTNDNNSHAAEAVDLSVFENTSMLAWTTTPWTLPSNLALCVNEKLDYVKFQDEKGDFYICGKTVLKKKKTIKSGRKGFKAKVLQEFKGRDLVGLRYKPLFNYFDERAAHCFRVICDDYVSAEDGTGVVHQAPGFGEDDLRACTAHGIHRKGAEDIVCPVDHNGKFALPVADYEGQYVLDANEDIIRDLRASGRLWNRANYSHEYPLCWRSDTPLIYRAIPSWFIHVEAIKAEIVAANAEHTYWVPAYVKEKRFHHWLLNARDWAVSRNRYWGTPLPIWISDDETEWEVIGSVAELEERRAEAAAAAENADGGVNLTPLTDLHREHVDQIVIRSRKTGKLLHRVDEVFDCWFESGAMPYGQCHYPFAFTEDKYGVEGIDQARFEQRFPADFIAEGLDQTRGWFYTLLVISTALFNRPAWQNLIVNGMVLAADGKKMSKRLQNYPDPQLIFDEFGADALRVYLCNSPVVRAESLRFKKEGVQLVVNNVLGLWWNAYKFLIENARRYERETGQRFAYIADPHLRVTNVMDQWILSELQSLIVFVRTEMKEYRLYTVIPRLVQFIDILCNWYLRMNRTRIRGQESEADAYLSLITMYHVLLNMCQLMAPLTPFIVESMYLNLRQALLPAPDAEADADAEDEAAGSAVVVEESIHFMPIPSPNLAVIDAEIERSIAHFQRVVVLGRNIRNSHALKTKQPLAELLIVHQSPQFLEDCRRLQAYIRQELNVKAVRFSSELSDFITLSIEPEHRTLGPKFKSKKKQIVQALGKLTHAQLMQFYNEQAFEVCGESLAMTDVKFAWNFSGDSEKWAALTEDNLLLMLDRRLTKDLYDEGVAREICNRIQKLRKKGRLVPADVVCAYYSPGRDDEEEKNDNNNNNGQRIEFDLSQVFVEYNDMIEDYCRVSVNPLHLKSRYVPEICREVTDIDGKAFTLLLCVPQVYLCNADAYAEKQRAQIEQFMNSQNVLRLREKFPNGSRFKFKIDENAYELEAGKDFVYNANELKSTATAGPTQTNLKAI